MVSIVSLRLCRTRSIDYVPVNFGALWFDWSPAFYRGMRSVTLFFFHFHTRNNHSSRKHYSICDISYAALSKIARSNGDVSNHAFTLQKENQNWIKNGAMIISNTQGTPSERLSRFSLIGMPHFLWNVASDQVPNTPEFSTFSATTRVRNVKTCFVVLPKPWYFSRRL